MDNPQQTRLVIIHDTDADGTAAAWCVNRLSDQYSSTLLIPQRAGVNEIPEELTENDSVFLVDRSYPWDTLITLSQQVFSVTVIDHHKSAMTDIYNKAVASGLYELNSTAIRSETLFIRYGNIHIHIDTTQAACAMCWHYHIAHSIDPDPEEKEVPWFIKYIEDRDLWKWKLPDSKEINAGIHFCSKNEQLNLVSGLTVYDFLLEASSEDPTPFVEDIKNTGKIVLDTQLQIIKSIAHGPTVSYQEVFYNDHSILIPNHPKELSSGHYRFAVVCCPFTLISDLGSYMLSCTDEGFVQPDVVLCYNKTAEGYVYSIRSKVDMIWLAKEYGGGGHPNACGFKSKLPPETVLDFREPTYNTSARSSMGLPKQ